MSNQQHSDTSDTTTPSAQPETAAQQPEQSQPETAAQPEQPAEQQPEKAPEQPAAAQQPAPVAPADIAAPWSMAPATALPAVGGSAAPLFGGGEALAAPGKPVDNAGFSFAKFQQGSASGGGAAPGAPGGAAAAARGRGAGGGISSFLTAAVQQNALSINLEGVHACVVQDITEGGDGTSLTVNVRLKQSDTGDTSGKVTYWIKSQDGTPNNSDIKAWCELAQKLGIEAGDASSWGKAKGKSVGDYQFKKKAGYLNAYPC